MIQSPLRSRIATFLTAAVGVFFAHYGTYHLATPAQRREGIMAAAGHQDGFCITPTLVISTLAIAALATFAAHYLAPRLRRSNFVLSVTAVQVVSFTTLEILTRARLTSSSSSLITSHAHHAHGVTEYLTTSGLDLSFLTTMLLLQAPAALLAATLAHAVVAAVEFKAPVFDLPALTFLTPLSPSNTSDVAARGLLLARASSGRGPPLR